MQARNVKIDTTEWTARNGHSPRGKANWTFQIGEYRYGWTCTYGCAAHQARKTAAEAKCAIVTLL